MSQAKVVKKIKTHFLCSVTSSENRAIHEIMWKNVVQSDRAQMTIWRTCIACWIPKATDTHSEYVIRIAFPLEQWLCERASVLFYTYIVLFVNDCIVKKCKK